MAGGAPRRASARSRQQQRGQWRRQRRGRTAATNTSRAVLQAAGRMERCATHAPRGCGQRGRGQRQGKDLAAGWFRRVTSPRPWQRPRMASAPPRGESPPLWGTTLPDARAEMPGHRPRSHCLGCSSSHPPESLIPLPLATQVTSGAAVSRSALGVCWRLPPWRRRSRSRLPPRSSPPTHETCAFVIVVG